ncbi:ATP-grasp domain-containing protein [Natroniella sulfidigena]|uniref:ATP-grasp domain-containing protein n=1 Tax=Natroniella sulfidigena TaxID=723921 RepID=UPI00200A39C7|nr:ATP-grasp domain-containing protein [Natroniella sulfidigena]MCK8816295.1 ATP-grasp domain-containing protein [Natroniella sulfidigena]
MNILMTSAGRRTQLIKYFQQELREKGNIVAVDCNQTAPALYIADKSYIVPRIDDPNYLDKLKDICKDENVKAIISLLDPELSLLATKKEEFKEIGVEVIISESNVIETCFDKYKMFNFLKAHNFKTPKTYIDIANFEKDLKDNEIDFPVFVKPRNGSASLGINKVSNIDELKLLLKHNEELLIQEYMDGQEYGVDVYVDIISQEIISIFLKKKIRMRAGETDKAVSIKNKKLFNLIKEFIEKLGVVGQADIDVFVVDGEFYISEVNPRFGGGCLIAYECGENSPQYIINNLKGIENKPNIGSYEENMYMIRHDVVTMKHKSELIDCKGEN